MCACMYSFHSREGTVQHETVHITSADGTRLHGWLLNTAEPPCAVANSGTRAGPAVAEKGGRRRDGNSYDDDGGDGNGGDDNSCSSDGGSGDVGSPLGGSAVRPTTATTTTTTTTTTTVVFFHSNAGNIGHCLPNATRLLAAANFPTNHVQTHAWRCVRGVVCVCCGRG